MLRFKTRKGKKTVLKSHINSYITVKNLIYTEKNSWRLKKMKYFLFITDSLKGTFSLSIPDI